MYAQPGPRVISESVELDVLKQAQTYQSGYTTSAREVSLGTTANSGYISSGNADLSFHRDGTEVMRLNGTNVGIGTTAPTNYAGYTTLEVMGKSGPSGGVFKATSFNGIHSAELSTDSIGVNLVSSTNSVFRMGTNNLETFRLDTSNRLCIGKTSSLGYKVDILGQVGVEDGTIRAGWGAGMFTAGTMGFGTTSNHRLTLGTNAIARMAISGSGTVSIGRLEPASGGTLEVSGNIVCQPTAAAPTLGANGDMSFQLVSNTQLKVLVRGSDGTTRSVTLTLA